MRLILLPLLLGSISTQAQWTLQDSHTTASLRGIHALGNGIAWASGSEGTILHTTDNGAEWQTCTTPPAAEHLDFRGIQAFDAQTAIVMSSGKGDLSRLYKTIDACKTWKLVFTNSDDDGFWDAISARPADSTKSVHCSSSQMITGSIFGDPSVHKSNEFDSVTRPSFYLATFTINSGCSPDTLSRSASSIFSGPGEAAFAASNSILRQLAPTVWWLLTSREVIQYETGFSNPSHDEVISICGAQVPFPRDKPSQGGFSIAIKPESIENLKPGLLSRGPRCRKAVEVVVGGDYAAPDNSDTTAAFTGGNSKFTLARTPPHGYRSAVAYSPTQKTWITVGPNGTDVSIDDGRNWRALRPSATDPADEDKNWNALSLPFVVGPHGRVGLLRPDALQPNTGPK